MYNQSILNKVKENVDFSCVVFSGWRKGFWKEKNLLICYVMLGQGHDFEKVKKLPELEAPVKVNIHCGLELKCSLFLSVSASFEL